MPQRQRGQPGSDGQRGRPRSTAHARRCRFHVAPQDERGAHFADVEERPQRTQERGESAHDHAAQYGQHVHARLERERHEAGERGDEHGRKRHAEGGADETAGDTDNLRLHEEHRDDRTRRRAERFQDRDGRLLAPDERADRGGHSDAAHQQAGQAYEPEIGGELREEAPQSGLRLVEGRHADAGIADASRERLAQGARRLRGRKLDERPVPHAAAELQQAALLERLRRHEHARAERHQARRAVGLGVDDAADGQRDRAECQTITHTQTETVERLALHDGAVVGQQRSERLGRCRAQPSI